MEGFNADWMPTAYDTAAGPHDGRGACNASMTAGGMIVVIVVPATLPW